MRGSKKAIRKWSGRIRASLSAIGLSASASTDCWNDGLCPSPWAAASAILDQLSEMLAEPERTFAGRLFLSESSNQPSADSNIARTKVSSCCLGKTVSIGWFRAMELSTQILLFDAIQRYRSDGTGWNGSVLKLAVKDHVEYVKNANMTSKDQYIVPLIMANKTVTKKS